VSDTSILISALETAPGVIIPLIREVPPQILKEPGEMVRLRARHSLVAVGRLVSVFIMFRHLLNHEMLHAYRIEELLLKKDLD
jgi:hypothetical protein